jgi:glutamate-ammonia-ligase adenylyltransferase
MRATIAEEKPPRDIWDLKLVPGGLIDLEFIAQCARLTGRIEPDVWPPTSTGDALARLTSDFCDAQVRDELEAAYLLYLTLTQITRLCLDGPLDPADIPPGLADLLLRSTDLPDLSVLEAHIQETSQRVENHFGALLRRRRR